MDAHAVTLKPLRIDHNDGSEHAEDWLTGQDKGQAVLCICPREGGTERSRSAYRTGQYGKSRLLTEGCSLNNN